MNSNASPEGSNAHIAHQKSSEKPWWEPWLYPPGVRVVSVDESCVQYELFRLLHACPKFACSNARNGGVDAATEHDS